MKEVVAESQIYTVYEWGPSWEDMQVVVKELGQAGIMLKVKVATDEDLRRGVDILPELELYDRRFRPVIVTPGLYVVCGPLYRSFRVVDREELLTEYQEVR